eukprot:844103-Prorocentrum_minimum.AAC.1
MCVPPTGTLRTAARCKRARAGRSRPGGTGSTTPAPASSCRRCCGRTRRGRQGPTPLGGMRAVQAHAGARAAGGLSRSGHTCACYLYYATFGAGRERVSVRVTF